MSKYKLYCGDCLEILRSRTLIDSIKGKNVIIVTDPPFNIGYHYNSYKDDMDEEEYYQWLQDVVSIGGGIVVVHYPEQLYKFSHQIGQFPERIVSWVYNSNTTRQHRDVAFFGIMPNFNQVKQAYKNPNDKRIKALIESGSKGAKIYDWWYVNQVKNTSSEKTLHPCQMPQEVMDNIIGVLPKNEKTIVIDPFMGSGTTGIACQKYGVDFIGIEIDQDYYSIAKQRMEAFGIERLNNFQQKRMFGLQDNQKSSQASYLLWDC